jgi:hypothetical protein
MGLFSKLYMFSEHVQLMKNFSLAWNLYSIHIFVEQYWMWVDVWSTILRVSSWPVLTLHVACSNIALRVNFCFWH